jgi:hypothetical protein
MPKTRDTGGTEGRAPASPRRSPRALLDAHLGSRGVARVIYGAIIGLALVVALESHPPTAGQTVAAVLGTAVAVGLAELYSEVIGAEARTHQPIRRAHVRAFTAEAATVTFGAGFPALFFLLAAVDLIRLDTAFKLSKWTGLGLICAYGFAGARLAGLRVPRALLHAAAVGAIGGALIALKSLLH